MITVQVLCAAASSPREDIDDESYQDFLEALRVSIFDAYTGLFSYLLFLPSSLPPSPPSYLLPPTSSPLNSPPPPPSSPIGIIQGFRQDGTGDLFLPHAQYMMEFIDALVNERREHPDYDDSLRWESLLNGMIGVIGDLAELQHGQVKVCFLFFCFLFSCFLFFFYYYSFICLYFSLNFSFFFFFFFFFFRSCCLGLLLVLFCKRLAPTRATS